MDAFEGIAHQDEHIVGEAMKEKKGIILVVNKWDKVMNKPGVNKDTILERYMHYLSKKFDFLSYAPVVFTTAIENKRMLRVQENRAVVLIDQLAVPVALNASHAAKVHGHKEASGWLSALRVRH